MKLFIITIVIVTGLSGFVLSHQRSGVGKQREKLATLQSQMTRQEAGQPRSKRASVKLPPITSGEALMDQEKIFKAREHLLVWIEEHKDYNYDPGKAIRSFPKLLKIVEDLTTEEFVALIQQSDLMDEGVDGVTEFVAITFTSIAMETNPYSVLDEMKLPKYQAETIRTMALIMLAQKDIRAAKEWVETKGENFSPSTQEAFQATITSELILANPVAGLTYLRESGLEVSKMRGLARSFMGAKDGGISLAQALRKETDSTVKNYIAPLILKSGHLRFGLSHFCELADTIYPEAPPEQMADLITEAGILRGIETPEAATATMKLVSERATGIESQALTTLVQDWASRNFAATGTWLQSLPKSTLRDSGIMAYIGQVVQVDLPSSMEWAGLFFDDSKRSMVEEAILKHWSAEDPQAVEAWKEKH